MKQRSGRPQRAPRGTVTTHPAFAECQHQLLTEWDHQCNEACGNYPHNTKLRSNKQIFWLCNKCPAGQEHSWSAEPVFFTGHKSGCPICAGHVACRCKSLQVLFPDIATEWDQAKNTGQPRDYTAHSMQLAWWCSPQRGSWQQAIHTRTNSLASRLVRQRRRNQQYMLWLFKLISPVEAFAMAAQLPDSGLR